MNDATQVRVWERTILATHSDPGTTYKPPRTAAVEPLHAGFALGAELARGGMGVVFRARQSSLGRDVAVKKIKPDLADDEALFIAEARITGLLDHPNIVPVHELARTPEGELFLTMKLVGGAPWNPADRDDNLEILLAVCNAVAFAHSRGIVHADLKPENVMVGEFGEELVMDWGLAVRFGEGPSDPCGTPSYMAPEQAEGGGKEFGPQTDTYLLGGLLHKILTGRPPHAGRDMREVLRAAAEGKPPDLPGELGAICAKALSPHRYASVVEFQRALRDYVKHRESRAIAEAARETLGRREFAEAIAGFRQARVLWDGNADAREGEHRAREAYAESALAAGDFGLAEAQARGEELRGRIAAARRARERAARNARLTRRALMAAAVVMVVGAAVGFVAVNREQTRTRAARERAKEEEIAALEMMRNTARIALESALLLRRQGLNAHIRGPLPALQDAYARALERAPDDAEVEWRMGRMYRALMEDERALEYQNRALAKNPDYGPARYEKAVLLGWEYRRRMERLEREAREVEGRRLAGKIAEAGFGGEKPKLPTRRELRERDEKLGELKRAIERELERLEQLSGVGPAHVACAEGILLLRRGKAAEAEAKLAEAVAALAELEEAYEALWEAAMERGSYEEAIGWCEKGSAVDKGYLPHVMNRASARVNWGVYKKNRGEDPGLPAEARERASAEVGEQYGGAIADYDAALALNPAYAEALMGRANARVNWGLYKMNRGEDPGLPAEARERASAEVGEQYGGAIADYDAALALNPAYAQALMNRASARVNWGLYKMNRGEDPEEQYGGAIADYDAALALNPAYAEALMGRASARGNWGVYRDGRGADPSELYSAAIADLDRATQINPGSAGTYVSLASVRVNLGDYRLKAGEGAAEQYRHAIAACDRALQVNAADPEAWWWRGWARTCWARHAEATPEQRQQAYDSAIRDAAEAVRLNPRHATAHLVGGIANHYAGRGEEATAAVRAALGHSPSLRGDPFWAPWVREILGE